MWEFARVGASERRMRCVTAAVTDTPRAQRRASGRWDVSVDTLRDRLRRAGPPRRQESTAAVFSPVASRSRTGREPASISPLFIGVPPTLATLPARIVNKSVMSETVTARCSGV
jgi:hypothetical protein